MTEPETMTVRVRDRASERPWGSGLTDPHVRTITISGTCPTCGGPRGKPYNLNQCDDGAYYSVDVWHNPCGHVDQYTAVIAEATARAELDREAQAQAERERQYKIDHPRSVAPDAYTRTGVYLGEQRDV